MELKSTRFSLQAKDFLRGALLAIGTPVLTFLIDSLNAEEFTFNGKKLGVVAVAAFLTYILKNYFTDDVAVAKKTIESAKEKAIDESLNKQ